MSGPELSRCGGGAGVGGFNSGVVGSQSTMAPGGPQPHGVASARIGREMRSAAKQQFRQSRPSSCVYCWSLIKSDMYRHVARLHLDMAQLWRCPVSWYTVWKGTPQDCMDHLRGDIHLSLVHHYRVRKRGLPHIALRKNYLSQLQALLPLPVGLPPARVVSGVARLFRFRVVVFG